MTVKTFSVASQETSPKGIEFNAMMVHKCSWLAQITTQFMNTD